MRSRRRFLVLWQLSPHHWMFLFGYPREHCGRRPTIWCTRLGVRPLYLVRQRRLQDDPLLLDQFSCLRWIPHPLHGSIRQRVFVCWISLVGLVRGWLQCCRPVFQFGDTLSLIHISEPTRLGMISYAVFCLKKKNKP